MKFIGNLLWLIFGGLETAITYFAGSLVLMLTIVGIPFAFQTFKIGVLCLWPFGSEYGYKEDVNGCLASIMNVIWIFVAGIWIFLAHIIFGVLLCITIFGIPFGLQHFKLARLALSPFGREIVSL